ncbi:MULTISPECIES: hypothetical protein [Rhodobacterales]|jgi:hypothetical protein|uniref:Uncharacterized protein n=1 Tax=Phaeobacter gallaeciensis TaxID=60890 RepID=A0A1B0ZQ83_9RHOB|nr:MULTISPECIES: hypothetical protein [Phaeobacter]ANP36332.1 hypothetical protein JL2886_01414 [Phaeobacter gallaeciensis]MDE4060802.1 hypothetical protein [Phaeobacter gallaeciensis]MDE4123771.1 hypothetical protein [Phaeobacter gallaeciensis]MDE4128291.1 hypothetical protein [Phaeobacter gallaeciensis]MDE4140121.1 hypothetical protein [Phaeobacter gallaeciensis]
MNSDLFLVLGLLLAWLAIPSMLSAYSDKRRPQVSVFLLLGSAGLIAYAFLTQPGGYRLRDVPDAFFNVIGQVF